MVTARVRISRLEGIAPTVQRGNIPSPLPSIVAAVEARGGRRAGETWADAMARLAGVTTRELMADLRRRADA